jgi:hypothetical protein
VRARVAGLVVIAISCSGNEPRGTPEGAVDHTLTLAKAGEQVRVGRMFANSLRRGAYADNQLGPLAYWVWMRSAGSLGISADTFDRWDPPQLRRASGGTATVATTLHFDPLGPESDAPLPLVVDLVVEAGHWRIANARVESVPAWFTEAQKWADENGRDPPELVDLATVADSYRPPPPR